MTARELLGAAAAHFEAHEFRAFMDVDKRRFSETARGLLALAKRFDEEEAQMPERWDGGATAKMLARLDADLSPPDNPRTAPTPPVCDLPHVHGGNYCKTPYQDTSAAPVSREGQEATTPAVCETCGSAPFYCDCPADADRTER